MKYQRLHRKSEKGFTIIELTVVMLIFSIIGAALQSLINLSNVTVRTYDLRTRISSDGLQVLRTIARELGQTSYTSDRLVITTSGGNGDVKFQIPVDYDDDGDVVASNMTKSIEWGAYDNAEETQKGLYGNNPLNRWVRYYVENGQLKRGVLDSMGTQISNLTKVVGNDVQSFTVAQNTTSVTLSANISVTDVAGQSGVPRTQQGTFNLRIDLNNAPT